MDNYVKGEILGQGTFGTVFKATHKLTGQTVAIKKINLGDVREGINVTALREIKLLKELRSPHLVGLIDVFPHKRKNLQLVFEYCETDLELVIKDRSLIFSAADVKSYMKMLLQALDFCHKRWVLHRDIKPNNFLIAPNGELKLADFGLARIFGSPDRKYTNQVFARWYRAPELLFGSTQYTSAVDMWAAGCVFAELLLRRPWFPSETDIEQLSKIFQALGTPTPEQWPGAADLPQFLNFAPSQPIPLRSIFRNASEDALDLLSRLVAFDPARRLSAAQALEHRYFRSAPAPTPPSQLPRPAPRHPAAQTVQPASMDTAAAAAAAATANGAEPTGFGTGSSAERLANGATAAQLASQIPVDSQQKPAEAHGAVGAAATASDTANGAAHHAAKRRRESHSPDRPTPPGNEALQDARDGPHTDASMRDGSVRSAPDTGGSTHSAGGAPTPAPGTAVRRLDLDSGEAAPKRQKAAGGLAVPRVSDVRPPPMFHNTPSTAGATPAPPASSAPSTDWMAGARPQLASGDLAYLRKRKLDMDSAFDAASNPRHDEAPPS